MDAELSRFLSVQDIRENAQSSTTDPDAVQLSSSSVATCVADAVRRASESLSLQPLSNIWEQGLFFLGAIFTGNMSDWLSTFDSSLHRLVEPPVFCFRWRARCSSEGRAPAAIAKRTRSLEKVTTGVQQMGYSFPCSERAFYEILCRERSRGAPCSRLHSYRQCMAFAVYVMGVDELKPCVLSKRCLGCAVDNSPKEPSQVG